MEFNFIPNALFMLFPIGYFEQSYETLKYAYGDHNFVRGTGSCMLVFFFFELILAIYLIVKYDDLNHLKRIKHWQ